MRVKYEQAGLLVIALILILDDFFLWGSPLIFYPDPVWNSFIKFLGAFLCLWFVVILQVFKPRLEIAEDMESPDPKFVVKQEVELEMGRASAKVTKKKSRDDDPFKKILKRRKS